jgi:hypothetical protein
MLNFVLRWLTFWMSIHITNGSIVRDHLMIIHVQLGFNQKFNFGEKKKRHYVENYSDIPYNFDFKWFSGFRVE